RDLPFFRLKHTFYHSNLHYDGAGPDAFFWVGTGDEPNTSGRKIPNEKGSLDVLNGYEGEDIELKLPDDLTVYDIDWLSVWCVAYKHNFGHVRIPRHEHELNVPPSLDKFKIKKSIYTLPPHYNTPRPTYNFNSRATPKSSSRPKDGFSNCKDLLEGSVQLQWDWDGDEYVKFKLSGRITEKQWVALGFSPLKGRTQMVGADAVVVYFTPHAREKYHADDYFMSAKSQCDGKDGVCPDKRIGGSNDIQVLHGARKNGVTTVMFRRPMRARDGFDLALEDDEVNIFVAIGNLNGRNEANYHFGERTGPEEDIRITPKGKGDHSCLTIIDEMPTDVGPRLKSWPTIVIEGVTNFTARIGPTGGKRGYTAITGNPSWGICWYLNDQLIPEIYVERGETYHFWVEGGDDNKNPSRYHPFYITDSAEGGYGQKSESEQALQKIYAGVGFDSSGYPYPLAAGRYCEWEHKTIDKSSQSDTFESYFKTLALNCEDGRPSSLSWTCYTHNNLGWKIHVLDKGRTRRDKISSTGASSLAANRGLVVLPCPTSFSSL
ncbi:Protein Skeletor, isoforms B/C, partial [Orchesella cincta]